MSVSAKGGLAVAAAMALLAGCAEQPRVTASGARIYYVDTQGAAALCTVPPKVELAAGQQTEATMVVKNDGGWCGITVAQSGPKPYDAGLLVGRPEHGRVHVHKVGDVTRIDYTPDAGFGGEDRFSVRLLPGNPALKVMVTVQYTPPPAPPAPPPAAAPAKRAPAKKR
ncbi:hypothetical protein [Dankookia sp. P2]|uniref:hypothetical protein n=1 Tax=Dankookia sp. P2 TaxID=3423955 RepID=UPI003D6732EE